MNKRVGSVSFHLFDKHLDQNIRLLGIKTHQSVLIRV